MLQNSKYDKTKKNQNMTKLKNSKYDKIENVTTAKLKCDGTQKSKMQQISKS